MDKKVSQSQEYGNPNMENGDSFTVQPQQADPLRTWQSIVTRSSEFLTILDQELRLVYINHVQPGIESYLGTSVFEYVDPRFHDRLRESVNQTLSTGLPHYFESAARGPNGEESFYSNWVIAFHSHQQPGNIAIIGMDISQSARMARAAQDSEEKYRRIFDTVPTSIMAVDKTGKITDVNPYHIKVIGENKTKKSDYIGKDITHHPSIVSAGLSEVYRKVLDGVPFNMKNIYFPSTSSGKDGYFNIFGEPQYEGEQIIGAIFLHENVTHLKEAIELKQRLTTILESTSDFVGIADSTGKTIYINSATRNLLGIGPEEDVSNLAISSYHPEDDARMILEQGIPCAMREGIWRGETFFQAADGRQIPTSQIIIAHKSITGETNYFSTIARDISEQKANEQELIKYREHLEELVSFRTRELESAIRELESFAYAVSHDLRSPLRSIASFSQILVKDYTNGLHPTALDYLNRVQRNAIYMSELIDDMLNLSRISRHTFVLEEVSLSQFVNNSIARLQALQPDHQVDTGVQPDITCKGDALLLSIMIDNLVNNAWKYTRKSDKARIEFGFTTLDGNDVYFIRDNGVGFDMQYADKLFKPFQRLHHASEFEGHGIGLATVMRIINRHGGTIWVESKEDQGCTFYFTLDPQPSSTHKHNPLL